MANCLLCWPNRAESSVLAGGSWLPALPLSNLQNRYKAKVARSTNLLDASLVINADLGQLRYLTSVALVGHNFSITAQARVRFWADAGMTQLVYDSGMVEVWPRWFDTMQLRWADTNFWGGRISVEQQNTVPPVWVHIPSNAGFFANAQSVRAVTFNFSDPSNESGYVQIGRMYMAEDWTPVTNMVYGASMQWNDPSVVDTSLDGTEYYEQRPKYRSAMFELKYMKHTEGVNKASMMALDRGTTKDFLFIFDPEVPQLLQQRSFIGRLSQINPLMYPMFARTSMAYNIKEVL